MYSDYELSLRTPKQTPIHKRAPPSELNSKRYSPRGKTKRYFEIHVILFILHCDNMASLTAWLIDITGKKIQMYQYVCYSQASSYMPTFSSIFFRVNPNVATVPLIDELGDLLVFSHRTTKGESPFSHDPCR